MCWIGPDLEDEVHAGGYGDAAEGRVGKGDRTLPETSGFPARSNSDPAIAARDVARWGD